MNNKLLEFFYTKTFTLNSTSPQHKQRQMTPEGKLAV